MRCAACKRPLTNPVSIRHGFGPDCLRSAVKAGTAPLEALEELTSWKRNNVKQKAAKRQAAHVETPRCHQTIDLFDTARKHALTTLHAAAAELKALGVEVQITIKE